MESGRSPQLPPEPVAPGKILLVDDDLIGLRVLERFLLKQGYQVTQTMEATHVLALVETDPPDLILMDIDMPQISGYELCRRIRSHRQTRTIPVIFISSLWEGKDKVAAFSSGGNDYVTKPFQFEEVLARVENQLSIQRMQQQLRDLNSQLEQRVQHRTQQLQRTNQVLQQEVLKRRQAQDKLMRIALRDSLTGLPNRRMILGKLAHKLKDASRSFALLFLDFNRFKLVNDSLGHSVGDQLLKAIAERLQAQMSPDDLLGRLGGDEFLLLIDGVETEEGAVQQAQQIQQALRAPFFVMQSEVFLSASIGIVLSQNYQRPEEMLRDADIAMYRAKSRESGEYRIFEPNMLVQAKGQLRLETDLRRAIERQEFVLCFQPIVCLSTREVIGFESLVRWQHPDRGWISPGRFIPIAEETGLIIPIGEWVLTEACRQMQHWQQRYPHAQPLTVGVNFSAKQFAQPDLLHHIDRILDQTGLEARYLKLEITESAVMENPEQAEAILQQLRARHIQISIDDFGTGYSSLKYLHRFSADTLKIDRSFVMGLGTQSENLHIVRAVITLAQTLGMDVIAEGIETEAQLQQLRALGCPHGQGYLFAKPLDLTSVETLLLRSSHPSLRRPILQPV